MSSILLTMPEDPAELPGWLERQLVGADLERLIAELTTLHEAPSNRTPLAVVLGEHRHRILTAGLIGLPPPALSRLLRQPELLLEFQQMVFTEGGPYWDRVSDVPGTQAAAARVHDRVMQLIAKESQPVRLSPLGRGWFTHAIAAFATAAAILIGAYLVGFRLPNPSAPRPDAAAGWGFAQLRDLPREGGDAAVLNRLADLAAEWAKTRPETPAELAGRLGEFRMGCSQLLLSDLPLSAPQRRWFHLRCADWAAATDDHLRRLEESRNVEGVRAAADEMVAGIVRELRERALQIGAS